MFKPAFCILAGTAVMGIALSAGTASAATQKPAALAYSNSPAQDSPGSNDTTVTFTVTVGGLTITAPATADLGGGAPGTTINGSLGAVTVTDLRAMLDATWTTTASSGDWTTGGGTGNETIPATDVGYDPGTPTTTGDITTTQAPITLSGAATPVVSASGVGDNTATWDPGLAVAVPAAAVGGIYTATLTESVS